MDPARWSQVGRDSGVQVTAQPTAQVTAQSTGQAAALFAIESRFAPLGPGRRMVRVVLPEDRSRRLMRRATSAVYRTEARILRRAGPVLLASARIDRGFRHQVRAHLAFMGFPILGDPLYGAPLPVGARPRMYLHASALEFDHPLTGEHLRVVSPLPPEFDELLDLP